MPYFKDAEDVYRHLGRLFEDIVADEELAARLKATDTVLQIRMRRPDSQLTVRALEAEDLTADRPPSTTVDVTNGADHG